MFVPGTGVWSIGRRHHADRCSTAARCCTSSAAAVAAFEQAAAQYRGTVMSAFQNVADALRALAVRCRRAARRRSPPSRPRPRAWISRAAQYQLGAINYLTLLNAQQTYQTRPASTGCRPQAARYADTAALFQALGGGWWNRTDVDPKSMGKPGVFALPPVQDIKPPRAGH